MKLNSAVAILSIILCSCIKNNRDENVKINPNIKFRYVELIPILKKFNLNAYKKNEFTLIRVKDDFDTTKILIDRLNKMTNTFLSGYNYEYFLLGKDTIYVESPIRLLFEINNLKLIKENSNIHETKTIQI